MQEQLVNGSPPGRSYMEQAFNDDAALQIAPRLQPANGQANADTTTV